jgi:hypothetical protein
MIDQENVSGSSLAFDPVNQSAKKQVWQDCKDCRDGNCGQDGNRFVDGILEDAVEYKGKGEHLSDAPTAMLDQRLAFLL